MKNGSCHSSSKRKLFFSREEIAILLGISLSSVDRGLKAKVPPFEKVTRIGRRVLIPVSCFEKYTSMEVFDE